MKKVVLFAAVVFGLSTMNAQKGSILLGGNVGYDHSEQKFGGEKYKSDAVSVNPYVGYQFSDNWTVGAKFGYTHAKFDAKDRDGNYLGTGDKQTNDQMRIGGFVRYTQPFNETFAIYGDIEGGWLQNEKKTTPLVGDKVKTKQDGFYVGFTPALFINFKNNFGLNFSIGGIEYSHLKAKQDPKIKDDAVKVTFGNAFNIGISKNFKL